MVEVKLLEAFLLTNYFPPLSYLRQKNDELVGLALLARTISLWITLDY